MTTLSTPTSRQSIPLEQITVPGNVRDLNAEHVDALARSIRLRGLLVPVIVRPADDGFELVAGFHRLAAHQQLCEASIDAEIRDAGDEHGDRAVENIASCRPRHEAINADLDCMPTSRRVAGGVGDPGWCGRHNGRPR